MRIRIEADSVKTEDLRALLAALANVGLHQTAEVGVNGPECWSVRTGHLTPRQFAQVVGRVVTTDVEGETKTLAEALGYGGPIHGVA